MHILGIPIRHADSGLLDRLLAERAHEDDRLEFKKELPKATPEGRVEFMKDVSAFANAGGGAIVYGVVENAGIASAITGLGSVDFDKESLRLEQTLVGVRPRIIASSCSAWRMGTARCSSSASRAVSRPHTWWRRRRPVSFGLEITRGSI